MYIVSTGYKTAAEAATERPLIMKDKEHTKLYREALTAGEYLQQEFNN